MFVEINGALLYQRRKAAQLTLDKLARATGLSYQELTVIEAHAHAACSPMVLAKLITALRCTDEDLLYHAGDGAIAARVDTFFDKIERNGISLTEVLKRALYPLSGEPMRFRARVVCDLLARNYNNMALQSVARDIYTIIFDSHLCASELALIPHPGTDERAASLSAHIASLAGLSTTQREQILHSIENTSPSVDTLIRLYGYLLDNLYNLQNQKAIHTTLATICSLLDTTKPPSQYQVDEFCYAITLILLNHSILERRFAADSIKTTSQKQLF